MKNNDLYFLILERSTDGIIITDDRGFIVFINKAAEQIHNIKRQDLLGQNILDCHRATSVTNVTRAITYLKENIDKTYHRMVTDQANHKYYENTYCGIYDEEKKFKGMAVITKDITQTRKLQEDNALNLRSKEIEIDALRLQFQTLTMTSFEMLSNILEERDNYTNGHSKRVATLSAKIYEEKFGIDDKYLDIIWASKLHDIGKICIPDSILNKKGKLTKKEYEIIKKHSTIASDIISPIDTAQRISPLIKSHHEWYNGLGYPRGISGNDIPLGSRIISIADSFDAMRSDRPYRFALPYDTCLEQIRSCSGSQFDPEFVNIFLDLASTGSIDYE